MIDTQDTRDRLLHAAAELLDEAQGEDVSTRAITERAGVQAPSLYHHFGSKHALIEAVLNHGFRRFLAERAPHPSEDPIADIRAGWDLHVRYGLENPSFYALIYGQVRPGRPCAVVAEVEAMILETLRGAARAGRLRVTPEAAAKQIVAASTGVVLSLITTPPDAVDLGLSDAVRDAVLAAITTEPEAGRTQPVGVVSHAIALRAALGETSKVLSDGEVTLLREWLGRLSEYH